TQQAEEEFAAWGEGIRIWSKAELHDLRCESLDKVHKHLSSELADRVTSSDGVGEVLRYVAAVEALLQRDASPAWIFKAPRGASGRAAIRVFRDTLNENQTRWLERTLRVDDAVVAEPWRTRVMDLSWQ